MSSEKPASAGFRTAAVEPILDRCDLSGLLLDLPYEFVIEDFEQILNDVVRTIAPGPGWTTKSLVASKLKRRVRRPST